MTTLPAELLPRPGRRSALPWLIAAAAFLMALAAASALALGRSAESLAATAAGRATIAIAEPDPARRDAAAMRALALVAKLPGTAATRVPQVEVTRLLTPYLGEAALDTIPQPALIDVTLSGTSLAQVRAALAPIPAARIEPEGQALTPLVDLVQALRRLALAVLGVSAIVAMLVTMLVARAALSGHAATVDILHGLGATDAQVAQLVERRTALDALVGGVVGLAAGVIAILLIGSRLATLNGQMAAAITLPSADWGVLAALPLAISLMAMAATRIAVLAQLRHAE